MKRYWIEYQDDMPNFCPMTFWVHREINDKPWYESKDFNPPRQKAVPGYGYPIFKVEIDGFIFEFSSFAEIQTCIQTLGNKVLPRTIDLSIDRGKVVGPNSHWLSRLPAKIKTWKYRKKAIEYLCYYNRSYT